MKFLNNGHMNYVTPAFDVVNFDYSDIILTSECTEFEICINDCPAGVNSPTYY